MLGLSLHSTISANHLLCFGESTGSATITVTGGVPPYNYNWTGGVNDSTANNLAASWYFVTVTDAGFNTIVDSVEILQPAEINFSVAIDSSTCSLADGAATITVSGGTVPYTYLWNNGQTTATAINLSTGMYQVTITDNNLCTITVQIEMINSSLYPSPQVNIGNDTTLCGGSSLLIDAGSGMSAYVWSTGSTTQQISVTTTGMYAVTVTGMNGCTTSDVIYVVFNPAPIVNLGSDIVVCEGAPVMLDAQNPGSSYQWSNAESTQQVNVTTTGTYSVTVTNAQNCSASDAVSVTVNVNPVVDLGPNKAGCEGDSFTLDAGNTGSTFLWSNSNTSQTITASTSGTYTVTVTNVSQCSASDSVMVFIFQLPVVNLGNDTALCIVQPYLLNAGNAGATFNWSNGAHTQTIGVTQTGTYSVTVTNAYNCVSTDDITVTAKILPSLEGAVSYSGGALTANTAEVYLFPEGQPGLGNALAVVPITSGGQFNFMNIAPGNYMLQVKLNNNSPYQHVMHTYYDSTYKWQEATIIPLACEASESISVKMYENMPLQQGVFGFSGSVNYHNPAGYKEMGEPVPGGEIYIELEPDDEPIANATSDTTGFWEVTGLPEGTYSIYVDIPGFPMLSTYSNLTLNAGKPYFNELLFLLDTFSSNPGIMIPTGSLVPTEESELIYVKVSPNPFSEKAILSFTLSKDHYFNCRLLDVTGKQIEQIENKNLAMGKYRYEINAKENSLKPGMYYLQMHFDNTVLVKKIVLRN